MTSNRLIAWAFAGFALIRSCRADDGILYYQGIPQLMSGRTHIRMVQEFVLAKIGRKRARVYCRFVLRNEGKTSKARIGFPDGNDHDGEFTDVPTKPSLHNFRSSVDSHPISTHIMKGMDYPFFHVKTVWFRPRQTRVVEDWYDVPLDESATDMVAGDKGQASYYVQGFRYIMASGGSWYGPIGRATVRITWLRPEMRRSMPVSLAKFGDPGASKQWDRLPKNLVIYAGFSVPKVSARSISFYRSNFEPSRHSDIDLTFSAMPASWARR
jgi:hypothetical protein